MWIKRSEYDSLKERLNHAEKRLNEYQYLREALVLHKIVYTLDLVAMPLDIFNTLNMEIENLNAQVKLLEADKDFYKQECGELRARA